MNEGILEKEIPADDRSAYLAEIERLYIAGLPTREIAMKLGRDGNHVGRNLRELKKRWARAAARQKAILPQTQCATIFREAMDGWQRSLKPTVTTTEHRDKEEAIDKTVTRSQEGPGDKTFLMAAVAALKTIRQFAIDAADIPPWTAHWSGLKTWPRKTQSVTKGE